MKIKCLVVGKLSENCYILENNGKAVIIDPGDEIEKIIKELKDLKVVGVLITHHHNDHIGALNYILRKYNLKEIDINEVSKKNSIVLRKGVVDFLKYTNEKKIPVIIISAGISNIIEGVLKKNNCFFNNVYVISNIFKFKDGKLKSLRNNIIHSLNKNKVEVPPKIKEILKNKDEVIIIGDNTGDTLMKVKEESETYKIGFLNYKDDLKIKEFKKCFDIIYTNNNDFNDIIELIQKNS